MPAARYGCASAGNLLGYGRGSRSELDATDDLVCSFGESAPEHCDRCTSVVSDVKQGLQATPLAQHLLLDAFRKGGGQMVAIEQAVLHE